MIYRQVLFIFLFTAFFPLANAEEATYQRLKDFLDGIYAIDTHDHLWPFDQLPGYRETTSGDRVMNLASIWQNSYLSGQGILPNWQKGETIETWWPRAKPTFDNVRTVSAYRYTLPAISDLYGINFETITDAQALQLNRQITENYRDQRWLYKVITEKANIEVMVNDPYWDPFNFQTEYRFTAKVLRLNPLFRGFHRNEFKLKGNRRENPYDFADSEGVKIDSFDDYLEFLDHIFVQGKKSGLVGLKHTLAYQRTLHFERVSKADAAICFGKRRSELTEKQIKAFEDFLMWHFCELSAKHKLPFQIHTGHGRLQGSNPMFLVDLIAKNPKTTFVLFHGGIPWVSESGAIAMRHRNVYLDCVWLPTLSQEMARRGLHEWLDLISSNRILWGADCNHAEGIYGAAEVTRQVLAKVLAERVDRGDLQFKDAQRIGRQILRENALMVFPGLKAKLWREKLQTMEPP